MTSQITPTFLFLLLSLGLFSGSAALSHYLSSGSEPNHAQSPSAPGGTVGGATTNANINRLRQVVSSGKASTDEKLELASELRDTAKERPDAAVLMEAVGLYNQVLHDNSENAEAIYGLASLCFEAGIVDKALEYYPKYLKLRPDDAGATIDYALVLVQAGQLDTAESVANDVIAKFPDRSQAYLAKALILKQKGDIPGAKVAAQRSLELTGEAEVRSRITDFIAGLEQGGVDVQGSDARSAQPAAASLSPATMVDSFFRNHPIISPKVQGIRWPSPEKVQVVVREFPVAAMPPFAKQKLEGSVKSYFSKLPNALQIELTDGDSGKTLLAWSVGAKEAVTGPSGTQ